MGTRWSKLTKIITGRTDNGIKNHWNSIMKKKLPELQAQLNMLLMGEKFRHLEKTKAISQLLNVGEEQAKDDLEAQSESAIQSEKIELTEPPLLMQKIPSDSVSFDHILKKIDQNDELNMKKSESYNYDYTLQ